MLVACEESKAGTQAAGALQLDWLQGKLVSQVLKTRPFLNKTRL